MVDLQEFKCPACGGVLEFDSGIQKMKCPYCDTEIDVQALKELEETAQQPSENQMQWEDQAGGEWQEDEQSGMQVYVCESCGGEIIADETTAASSCPYCGNPVVMKEKFAGDLRPDYVIPFKKSKKDAKAAYRKYLEKKPLLPKIFKDENHIDEIKGVYVPFWLFDADADVRASYLGERVRVWSDADYNYTKTSYFSVIREGSIGFDHIPVDGSSRMEDTLMESIEPFHFEEAVDFQTAYLSGYLADRYDVDASESIARANERIRASAEQSFRATADHYDLLTVKNFQMQLSEGKETYALYPVWILNTTWKDKHYLFAMNGQTGKMVGDLPVDKGALWRWRGIITAVVTAVVFGILIII